MNRLRYLLKLHLAILEYLAAVEKFESSKAALSYSEIEIPKIAIADSLLEILDIQTSPRGPQR